MSTLGLGEDWKNATKESPSPMLTVAQFRTTTKRIPLPLEEPHQRVELLVLRPRSSMSERSAVVQQFYNLPICGKLAKPIIPVRSDSKTPPPFLSKNVDGGAP